MAVGQSIGGQGFQEPNPQQPLPQMSPGMTAAFDVMNGIPSIPVSMGFNAIRGSNTLMYGARGGMGGIIGNNSPRSFFRFSNLDVFHPTEGKGIVQDWFGSGYSPFSLSSVVNKQASRIGKLANAAAEASDAGKALSKREAFGKAVADRFGGHLAKVDGKFAAQQEVLPVGMISHITAFGRLANMGGGQIGEHVATSLNTAMARAGASPIATGSMYGREASMAYAAGATQTSIGSRIMGRMAGSRFGAEAANYGGTAAYQEAVGNSARNLAYGGMERLEGASMKEVFAGAKKAFGREAVEKAGTAAAKEGAEKAAVELGAKTGVKFLGEAGLAAAGALAGPVGWAMDAWMIYDLAKTAATLTNDLVIKPGVAFAEEGFRSFKGQTGKAPFGAGFKDNSVAMTSRSRGVAAIQNSRLNARSLLGSEAASMHQHFG